MAVPPRDPETAEALARLYDVDLLEDPGDLDLYLALAARTGGPILEIASGTGRVALPLAEAGYEVTAVDVDPAMIARAEKSATAAGPTSRQRLEFVRSDLVGLALPGGPRFQLAILALNSILLLATRERQRQALETMARHLAPGGLAVVDAWVPSADELARYDGRTALEYVRTDPEGGLMVTKVTAATHEPTTGQVELTVMYEEGDQGAPARRWIRQDRLRLLDADELRSLAEAAGLEIEALAGDYDLSPVDAHDERVILVARRRESPAVRP
jgi:SAM-dependent methyltransferase